MVSFRVIEAMKLSMAIIARYPGWGILRFVAMWGTLYQLVLSLVNWIDEVMKEVGEQVGKMVTRMRMIRSLGSPTRMPVSHPTL
jgi:hypothetical protein